MDIKELWSLFFAFFKIGVVTFGGGYAMIPAIRHEFVEVRNDVTEEELLDDLAICQSVPGAIAINMALLLGNKKRGIAGAAFAALGMALPAILSILLICICLSRVPESPWITGALKGVTAASVALIFCVAWKQGRKILKDMRSWALAALSFVMIVFFGRNAIWAIILGAAAGFLGWLRERKGGHAG